MDSPRRWLTAAGGDFLCPAATLIFEPGRTELKDRSVCGAWRMISAAHPGDYVTDRFEQDIFIIMRLSIVDLATVIPGEDRHQALMNSIKAAQHIEKLGFSRVWVAEHHGTRSIAGRAPEVLIAAIAANTSTIRVGSGSVLLNHYSSFKVAEVFSTLNELYPGRIDLGAGRATTCHVTDFALLTGRNKQLQSDSDQEIVELVAWLDNSFPEEIGRAHV